MKAKLIIVFFLFFSILNAQNNGCYSLPHVDNMEAFVNKINSFTNEKSNDYYNVRIKCHILRDTNGNGGLPINDVYESIDILQSAFNPHQICFSLMGIEYIDNSYFNDFIPSFPLIDPFIFLDTLFKSFVTPNAIDVFFHTKGGTQGGFAQGFLYPTVNNSLNYFNDAVIVGGKIEGIDCIKSNVLSHEIAHVLGLFHVFEEIICSELVNGTNCNVCGDLVCDTEASFNLQFNSQNIEDATCNYIGLEVDLNNDFYTPDPLNIMEYTKINCMEYFTQGQGLRMRNFLASESALQKLLVKEDTLVYNQTIVSQNYIDAKNNIVSENLVIEISSKVDLKAGNSITILPNFHAKAGSNFVAKIDEYCSVLGKSLETPSNYTINNNDIIYKEEIDFNIFPNPTSEVLNFQFISSNFEYIEIYISDSFGRKLSKEVYQKPNKEYIYLKLNVNNFSKGIYYVSVKTEKFTKSKSFYIL